MEVNRKYLVSIFIFGLLSVDVALGNHPRGPGRVTSARVDIQTRNFDNAPTVPSSSSRLSASVFMPTVGVGPQHGNPSLSVDRSQRLSPSPRRIIIMPSGTAGSHRLIQPSNVRRIHLPQSALQAFHRSARPLRTSVDKPTVHSRESVPQNIAWLPSIANGPDIMARNLKVIGGTNPAVSGQNSLSKTSGSPSIQKSGPVSRTSINLGERQRTVSQSKQTNNDNLFPIHPNHNNNLNLPPMSQENQNNNGNNGQAGNSNFPGQGQGRSDLVSVNDVINLINSIRNQGDQKPSPTQSSGIKQVGHAPKTKEPTNALPARDTIQNLPMKTTRSVQGHGEVNPKKGNAASKSSSISKQKDKTGRNGPTGTTGPDPMLDMLVHFALMNANNERTDPLSSLVSNPALLAQLVQGQGPDRTGSTPLPFLPSILPLKQTKEQTRRQSEQEETPSAQRIENPRRLKNPGKGRDANADPSIGRHAQRPNKGHNTGDPVHDTMFASLMQKTMSNIREDLQEQLRQQLTETELPMGGSLI